MKKSVFLFALLFVFSCSKEENIQTQIIQEEPEEEVAEQPNDDENAAPEQAMLISPENAETVNQFLEVL